VNRDFDRDGPNQLWMTDITEHPTREGKVYCCVALDAWSRKVLGWKTPAEAFDEHLRCAQSAGVVELTRSRGQWMATRRRVRSRVGVHSRRG
jgi:transposase InsO family protein